MSENHSSLPVSEAGQLRGRLAAALLCLGVAAPAAEAATPHEGGGLAELGLVLGAKTGASFGQAFSELGTSFVGELEIGYTLPLPAPLGRDFEILLALQYAGPSAEGTGSPDERLPAGAALDYELTEQQLVLTLAALYRVPIGSDLIRPYVAAGVRSYFLRTEIEASAEGEAFGAHEETATSLGPYGALGGELFLGPGALLLELQVGYATLDGTIFADHNVGALNTVLGYRLFL